MNAWTYLIPNFWMWLIFLLTLVQAFWDEFYIDWIHNLFWVERSIFEGNLIENPELFHSDLQTFNLKRLFWNCSVSSYGSFDDCIELRFGYFSVFIDQVNILHKSLHIGVSPFVHFKKFFVDLSFFNSFDDVVWSGGLVAVFVFVSIFDSKYRRVWEFL